MLKKVAFAALLCCGFLGVVNSAQAYYPRGYATYRPYYPTPVYQYQYRYTPYGGYYAGYSGWGPYQNYSYRYYTRPVYPIYQPYPVYGPRLGVSYVTPRAGFYIGY